MDLKKLLGFANFSLIFWITSYAHVGMEAFTFIFQPWNSVHLEYDDKINMYVEMTTKNGET